MARSQTIKTSAFAQIGSTPRCSPLAVDGFAMSTWHDDESLEEALWYALVAAQPSEKQYPDAGEAAVVLAVEEPWLADVRRLVADQEELTGSRWRRRNSVAGWEGGASFGAQL